MGGAAGGLTGEDLVALHEMTVNQDEPMDTQQQPLDHMHEVPARRTVELDASGALLPRD